MPKIKLFFCFLLLFLLLILNVPMSSAQDSTQWHLPEDTLAQLGNGSIEVIVYSPDGSRLAAAAGLGIWIYDAATGTELALLTGHIDVVNSIAFSPDGSTLGSGSEDNTVRLWDVATGKLKNILSGHTDTVESVAFSPDGETLASGSRDKTIHLWDVKTGVQKYKLIGHIGEVLSVAFSPDGETLASGSWDYTIRLWNAKTRTHKQTLKGHMANIHTVLFSPDGKLLASGSGREIRLWAVERGAQKYKLIGHTGTVNSVAFSPDGETLASGSEDKTIRLWAVETGEQQYKLTGHTGTVNSVAFSPDGETLASGSEQEIRLWNAATLAYDFRSRAFSNRNDREGFIWGIGVGTGMANYTQSLVEYWGDAYEGPQLEARGTESAFITNIRIGHGLTDQFLFYYTSRIAWIPLRNLYRDTVIANGTAGLGVTIYPYNRSNLYLSGSVGLSTLATWFPPLELEKARATGLAVSAGIGYEFFPHSSVALTVSFGNASRTQIDERNHIELTNEVVTVLLTLNGLAY